MKKTLFVAFLGIMMLFSTSAYAIDQPVISCDTQASQDGGAAELEVSITNNPGIASWLFELTWDQTAVQFDGIMRGEGFSKGTFLKNDSTPGKLTVTWFNATNVAEDAPLFTVKFVTSGASGKRAAVSLSYSAADTVNEKGETISLRINDSVELIGGGNNETGSGSDANENAPASGSGPETGNQTPVGSSPVSDGVENAHPSNGGPGVENQAPGEKEDNSKNEFAPEDDLSSETAPPVGAASPEGTALTPDGAKMFIDVKQSDYFFDPVSWAVGKGITFGTLANKFSPDGICTRAQAVTFLWRSVGSPEPALFTDQFTDVSSDSYYYKAVMWAIENDITLGTGISAFSPDDTVTRGQLVTFLWRTAGKEETGRGGNGFLDVSEDDYYFDSVNWAVGRAIALGTGNGTFSPNAPCTRGQTVTFLYRFAQAQ